MKNKTLWCNVKKGVIMYKLHTLFIRFIKQMGFLKNMCFLRNKVIVLEIAI